MTSEYEWKREAELRARQSRERREAVAAREYDRLIPRDWAIIVKVLFGVVIALGAFYGFILLGALVASQTS